MWLQLDFVSELISLSSLSSSGQQRLPREARLLPWVTAPAPVLIGSPSAQQFSSFARFYHTTAAPALAAYPGALSAAPVCAACALSTSVHWHMRLPAVGSLFLQSAVTRFVLPLKATNQQTEGTQGQMERSTIPAKLVSSTAQHTVASVPQQ